MATAFSAKQETMRHFAGVLSQLDVPNYQVGPLPGENGVRVEYKVNPDDQEALEKAILRAANVYTIVCDRQPWKPDLCRIIARPQAEDGGATWDIEREWLPSGAVNNPDESEAREMLDRVLETQEVF